MRETPATPFAIEANEIHAIAIAYDELLSYWETVGYEGSLDAEEMPTDVIPDALRSLRGLLDRHAKWEHLTAAAATHHQVIECDPVRFVVATPASGPEPFGVAS